MGSYYRDVQKKTWPGHGDGLSWPEGVRRVKNTRTDASSTSLYLILQSNQENDNGLTKT
jgi:hypothetical protein